MDYIGATVSSCKEGLMQVIISELLSVLISFVVYMSPMIVFSDPKTGKVSSADTTQLLRIVGITCASLIGLLIIILIIIRCCRKARAKRKERLVKKILMLTHNLLNFLNGIIHLPFLALSVIIFRDIRIRT